MELKSGTLLKNEWYSIKEKIGEGGFGITYLADELFCIEVSGKYDIKTIVRRATPKKVVIKELFYGEFCTRNTMTKEVIVKSEFQEQWSLMKRRMEEEGNNLSKFKHQHIVGVLDAFQGNNTLYTVMDYIDGKDLGEILNPKGKDQITGNEKKGMVLPAATTVKYITQILSAIGAIHRRNIYHFDVKPGNIMIERKTDSAILIDFGTALAYNGDGNVESMKSRLSKIMNVQGASIPFCPTEIESGSFDFTKYHEEIDCPKTIDLYSAGATLYKCLTGQLPPLATRLSSEKEELRIPDDLKGTVDMRYLNVIKHAMQNVVKYRFQSAYHFIIALEDISLNANYSYYGLFSKAELAFGGKNYSLAIDNYKNTLSAQHVVDETDDICKERIDICENKLKAGSGGDTDDWDEKKYQERKIEFDNLYSKGEKDYHSGKYKTAIDYYRKAVAIAADKTLSIRPGFATDFDSNQCTRKIEECIKKEKTEPIYRPEPHLKKYLYFIISAVIVLLVIAQQMGLFNTTHGGQTPLGTTSTRVPDSGVISPPGKSEQPTMTPVVNSQMFFDTTLVSYTGNTDANGKPVGKGMAIYTVRNDTFSGEFRNGREDGQGVYNYKNGDRFEGTFVKGTMTEGTLISQDGKKKHISVN